MADTSTPWVVYKSQRDAPKPPAAAKTTQTPWVQYNTGGTAPAPQAGSAPPAMPGTSDTSSMAPISGVAGPALQTFSDATDVPLNLLTAASDPTGKHRLSGSLPEAWQALTSGGFNPHALNEQYNRTSQSYLEKTAPVDMLSSAMLHNPAARVAGSLVSEFMNPVNWLLPGAAGIAGKGASWAGKAASKVPGVAKAADAVMPMLDPAYRLRKVAGVKGDVLWRDMMDASKVPAQEAMSKTMDIMGPVKQPRQPGWGGILPNAKAELFPRYLTPEEKIEVLRRSTAGLEPKNVVNKGKGNVDALSDLSNIPAQKATAKDGRFIPGSIARPNAPKPVLPDDVLSQRGNAYRQAIKGMTAAQIAAHPGLLPPGKVFNPEKFVPMSGQFSDPNLSETAQEYVEGLSGQGERGGMKTTLGSAGEGAPSKKLETIDEVLKNEALRASRGQAPVLKKDFDPASALYNYLSRRGKNVAYEKLIQGAPSTLAKRIEYQRPGDSGQALMQKHLRIEDFAHWGNQAEEQFGKATAGMEPIVPDGWVTGKDVQKVLGSSPSAEQRVFRPEFVDAVKNAGASEPEAEGFSALMEGFNHLARIGVITNPVVHIAWNLFGNYLGAKGDPARLGYIANGKGWAEGAQWEKLAEQHGAHAHFATHGVLGGEPARLLTGGGTHPVPGVDALNRMLTRGWGANQKLVFDTYERRFSTALFAQKAQEFQAAGMKAEEAFQRAGIEVRKTLGDYANVNRTGLEKRLTNAMFFYPWLKTVIPFAAKTALKNPSWINKPTRAVQSWNEGMGDGQQSKSNQLSVGGGGMLSLPLPQRNLENVLNIVTNGKGLGGSLNAAESIVSTHLNPFWSLLLDASSTAAAGPQQPGGANRTTLFDKAAPLPEQVQQLGGSLAGRVPFGRAAQGSLFGLGAFPYTKDSPEKIKATHGLRTIMLSELAKYKALGDKDGYAQTYREFQELLPEITQGL